MSIPIRRFPTTLSLLAALGASLAVYSPAQGQSEEYRHYLEVPVVSGGSLARARMLLRQGSTEVRRIAIFGDSQESSPGGAGKTYIPRLQRRLGSRFEQVGETPFFGITSQGSGSPPAGWLTAISVSSQGPLPTTIDSQRVPPGLLATGNLLPSEGGPQQNGGYVCLVHDGSLTGDTVSQPRRMIDPNHRIAAEILVFDTGKNVGATYQLRPTNNPVGWSSIISAGTFQLEPIPGCPNLLRGRSDVLDRGEREYHRLEILGSDPLVPTEIAGVRFVDLDMHKGIVAQSFSRGGYTSADFISNHAQSGEVLKALAPNMAILQYGANDLTQIGPESFQQRIRDMIMFIRESVEDPCLPIILMGEPWRWLPAEHRPRQDEYPAAMEQIALEDAGVMAINLRRLLEERYGWNEDYSPHLVDLVHLTPEAQAAVADVVAELLLPAQHASCPGDFNNDGRVNGVDLGEFLLHFQTTGAKPDACPSPYDFDGDGLVNNQDLGWFLSYIGRCPREFGTEPAGVGQAE